MLLTDQNIDELDKHKNIQKWKDVLCQYSGKKLSSICLSHDYFSSIPFIDELEKSDESLFYILENKIKTGNIGGFFGIKNKDGEQLDVHIRSRFDDSEQQFFVKYMLARINGIDFLNSDFNTHVDFDGLFDFLIFLFPYRLRQAIEQGIYKCYKIYDYNDSKPKGKIDISRHIAKNIPFQGRIAYSFREYSSRNNLILLIREVIEHINRNYSGILNSSSDYKRDCQIVYENCPNVGKISRRRLIEINSRQISNPYFTEYESLRQLCIRILRNEEIKYSSNPSDEIYGIVYDLAWLWEEYISLVLPKSFIHYKKADNKKFYLFKKTNNSNTREYKQQIIPDYLNEENKIVADAKYMTLNIKNDTDVHENKAKDIYYKTIMYMHRFSCSKGMLIYPIKGGSNIQYTETEYDIVTTDEKTDKTGGKFYELGLAIPQSENFVDFCKKINDNEIAFRNKIEIYSKSTQKLKKS